MAEKLKVRNINDFFELTLIKNLDFNTNRQLKTILIILSKMNRVKILSFVDILLEVRASGLLPRRLPLEMIAEQAQSLNEFLFSEWALGVIGFLATFEKSEHEREAEEEPFCWNDRANCVDNLFFF